MIYLLALQEQIIRNQLPRGLDRPKGGNPIYPLPKWNINKCVCADFKKVLIHQSIRVNPEHNLFRSAI